VSGGQRSFRDGVACLPGGSLRGAARSFGGCGGLSEVLCKQFPFGVVFCFVSSAR
jgi:hypothetical protein